MAFAAEVPVLCVVAVPKIFPLLSSLVCALVLTAGARAQSASPPEEEATGEAATEGDDPSDSEASGDAPLDGGDAPEAGDGAAPLDPSKLEEGEIVERDGVLYEVRGGELVDLGGFDDEEGAFGGTFETSVTGSRVDSATNPVVRTDTIGEDRIAETGARNVAEVLERVGGVQVGNSIGGTGQEISLDGVDSKYVLILIDGRPVNGQTNDRVDISRLPVQPSEIKRIEIVRGPMSALYGSEALGGVVNIITRRPRSGLHGQVEVGMRVLKDGLQRNAINGSISGGVRGVLVRLAGSGLLQRATDRAGYRAGVVSRKPDGASDLPHRRQGTLSGEVTLYPTDVWKLQTYGRVLYSELETRLAGGVPVRDHTRNLQLQVGSLVEADVYPGHTLTLDVRLDRFTHRFAKLPDAGLADPPAFCEDPGQNDLFGVAKSFRWRYFDPECPASTQVRTAATQDDARVDARYTGNILSGVFLVHELKASGGLLLSRQNWFRFDGDGQDSLPGATGRNNASLYGEVMYRPFSWLRLLPGFRADAVLLADPGLADLTLPENGNPFAWALGPKLSGRVDLPWGFAVRGSYGQGFRVPSFSEQFLVFDHTSLGYVVEGNPQLQPEYSHGVRGELSWTSEWLSLSGEVFANLFTNLIGFRIQDQRPDGTPIYTYENIDRATTSGLNLRMSLPTVYGFSAEATYQYLFTANDVSGCPEDDLWTSWTCPVGADGGAEALLLRPAHSLHLGARYTESLTDTTFFTQMDLTSQRVIDDEGNAAPQTFRLTAGLRQPIFDHAELILTFDNLLDAYHPIYGPKPGRSAMATFRAWF